MRIEFNTGYVFLLRWLLLYRENVYYLGLGAIWDKVVLEYNFIDTIDSALEFIKRIKKL